MKRRHGGVLTAVATLMALVAVTAAPTPASAKSHHHRHHHAQTNPDTWFVGHAGGSMVQAFGTTIRSDLTGASGVQGAEAPAHDDNRVAGVNVAGGLVKLGTVSTWAQADPIGAHGVRMVTGGRTADVSLLGGLIRADAVETVSTAKRSASGLRSSSSTEFVGLTINGQHYPANVPENTTVLIPGVAYVSLNSSYHYDVAGGTYVLGYGLLVSLVKPFKNVPAASTVLLNPTQSIVTPAPPANSAGLGGTGYGSAIKATVGPALDADASPSAVVFTPAGGTGKDVVQNATAGTDVPQVLHTGAVRSWTTGVTRPKRARVTMNNQIGGVDVLSGLITADAISTRSVTRRHTGNPNRVALSTTFVNLTVGGQSIPVDVSPNTAMDIAGVGHLVLNEQVTDDWGGYVRALHLTLSTERDGLPAGTEIEVSVALTYILG
jgi:hypothetical protein